MINIIRKSTFSPSLTFFITINTPSYLNCETALIMTNDIDDEEDVSISIGIVKLIVYFHTLTYSRIPPLLNMSAPINAINPDRILIPICKALLMIQLVALPQSIFPLK